MDGRFSAVVDMEEAREVILLMIGRRCMHTQCTLVLTQSQDAQQFRQSLHKQTCWLGPAGVQQPMAWSNIDATHTIRVLETSLNISGILLRP